MSKLTLKTIVLSAVMLLAGCCFTSFFGSDNQTAPQSAPTADGRYVQGPAAPSTADNDFVNYRETAADFREYGERTPRDQDIVTSGGASNMSAAVPPAVDEEVTDYENEVNAAMSDSGGDETDGNNGDASADDPVEDWLAEEGSTLKGLLSDWSERAGWRLIWNTNRNYTLSAGAMFRGRFADVASALIRTFARARPAPIATFYKGNRVLVVETMEDENAYN